MSLQRLLLTFDPVDAVLPVRVLGVIIKQVLFHRRVSDELGSNLLELCTTLLVDASGASSSVIIKSVTRALMMIFSAVSGCSTIFLSISINAQMLVMTESSPCLGGRWELYGPRHVQTPLRPACCRENIGQLISRILRQTSRSQLRMQCVTVLPRFKAIDEIHPVNSKPANSCVHLFNRSDVVRCRRTSSC